MNTGLQLDDEDINTELEELMIDVNDKGQAPSSSALPEFPRAPTDIPHAEYETPRKRVVAQA